MRRTVTAFFVMSFFALEAALFYAGHLGLNLADMTAPARAELMAKASLWRTASLSALVRSDVAQKVPKDIAAPIEDAWKQLSARSEREKPASTAEARPTGAATATPENKRPGDSGAALDALAPAPSSDEPRIDVARISPDGSSVFAGTAKPDETITLFADGKAVAEVTADETGSWSIVTNHRFANLDPKLSLERGRQIAKSEPASPETEQAIRSEDHATDHKLAAKEAQDALKNFEAIVDAARRESAANGASNGSDPGSATAPAATRAPAAETPAANSTPENAQTLAATPPNDPEKQSEPTSTTERGKPTAENTAPKAGAAQVVKIPVPITFVYKTAELTEEGAYAARLLLDYVKLKGLPSLSLTGHADERGSNAYNYDLSRERLDTIAKILREGGYEGRLHLIPKGKSEPYQGVDRTSLPREALYQIDRRVELKYVR